jgi:hypothetical protein
MTTLDIRGTIVGETAVAIKAPCLVATTGSNIALSGVQAIDGVTVGNDAERVLVKDQTVQNQNGIYIAGTGHWVLAADWTNNNNVAYGTMVLVAGGAVNAGLLFVQTCSDNPVVIGTSNVAFVNELSLTGSSQTATSTSSLAIGTGSKALTIQANKNLSVNQWVLVQETSNPANQMLGQITSYSGTSLVVSVVATGGSGTHVDWTIVLTNSTAAAGYQPPTGTGNVTGPGSSTAGHLATFVDGTGKLLADGGAAGSIANLSALTAQYLAASAVMFGVSMINGTIVASVAGNALTFAIKTLAGNDPSAGDPVWFVFRDATLANGDYSVIAVTTALSTTIPSGSTLGTSSSTPFKLWLTAVNDAGTVSLAVINCYNTATNNIYPLSGDGVVTVTAYGGGANSVATFYGTAGHSNVPYSILGFATYETGSTLATAGTWSAGPTRQVLYRPGIALPGDTVQSLLTTNSAASTGSNNLTFNTSAPTAAAGNLVASQAITPKSSAHLVRIEGQALIGTPSGTATADIGLWVTQDAGANALCTASTNTSRGTTSPVDVGLMFQQLANTLVSTTFKLYAALNGSLVVSINTVIGGSAFYGGTANSYILVEEIAT